MQVLRDRNSHERGFEHVAVNPTVTQSGQDRFFSPGTERPWPKLCPWRLNLTALSHVHNLFFLASSDTIHVYEPKYPEQSLLARPALAISPPESRPGLSGYIDPTTPHSINNVLVDFLGEEEVLVVCCDDGDVIGYHTNAIREAIRVLSVDESGHYGAKIPRHFLLDNVGMSAWGLSIHREARMIAISANTGRVTVIAFALSDGRNLQPDPSDEQQRSESTSLVEDPSDFPLPRRKQHRIVLPSFDSNLPSVSFCNTGQDPTGRWLLFSDIDGKAYVWDLHMHSSYPLPAWTMQMQFCPGGLESCGCAQYSHMVWKASWLDTKAFRKVGSIHQATGSERASCTSIGGTTIWDNSCSRNEILNWTEHFANPDYAYHFSDQPSLNADTMEVMASMAHGDIPIEWPARTMAPRLRASISLSPAKSPNELPSSPILFISNKDIFLVDSPKKRLREDQSARQCCAITAFNDPLYQRMPPVDAITAHLRSLNRFDRMNMFCEIPELGVVVSASGKGRAAVLTLTHFIGPHESRADMRNKDFIHPSDRPAYSFRVEHILPFASQEGRKERPETILMGIAAGPVQGSLGLHPSELPRRWRLMLYYYTHTVLAYELSREPEKGTGVTVETLIL